MLILVALMAVAFTHASAREVCNLRTLCAKANAILATNNEILSLLRSVEKLTPLEATLQGIEQDRFVVSEVNKDRIYLSTKVEAPFNIEKANDDCKSQGGYLVELDDATEAAFLINFVKKVGGPDTEFATGANDLVNEGTFVYYNSGKPVPKGLPWNLGEPNNKGPNGTDEDCVFFWSHDKRLNDAGCKISVKYVCEVPLRDI